MAFFPRLVDALFVSAPSLYLSPVLLDPRAVSASALSLQFLLLPESLSAAMTYHLFGASRSDRGRTSVLSELAHIATECYRTFNPLD